MVRRLIIGIMVLAGSLSSCDTTEDPPPAIAGGVINGQIDGAAWSSAYAQFAQPSPSTVAFYAGRDNAGNPTEIGIQIQGYDSLGAYPFNDTARRAYLYVNGIYYFANSGNAVVTQNDSIWFRTTFSFSATDSAGTGTHTASGKFDYKKK
ncbi:MAG: hypothetical protein EOP49_03765 [Sphingobacteriales bacterium]|nr:MAG: hypothetical protein EOP49_03765 [Sphingobacteriales bacterium]